MRKKLHAFASIAFGVAFAGPASADLAAGWDFSQWFAAGVLSIDGLTGTNALDANYSAFDPTFGAGAEAAAFGTLHFDGLFGSTNVTPTGTGTEAFIPSAGSLVSNLEAPDGVPFDTLTVLEAEGQEFQNLIRMTAADTVSIVFEVDLTSVPQTGSDWMISFGGQTESGSSMVGVEFSTDGISYDSFGSVMLDTTDALFEVELAETESDTGFVRLNFPPTTTERPSIDNVAIFVPEPGPAPALAAALIGLVSLGRLRRRSA